MAWSHLGADGGGRVANAEQERGGHGIEPRG
jgi:hypothetical protein